MVKRIDWEEKRGSPVVPGVHKQKGDVFLPGALQNVDMLAGKVFFPSGGY